MRESNVTMPHNFTSVVIIGNQTANNLVIVSSPPDFVANTVLADKTEIVVSTKHIISTVFVINSIVVSTKHIT